jgi:hypothetical protein
MSNPPSLQPQGQATWATAGSGNCPVAWPTGYTPTNGDLAFFFSTLLEGQAVLNTASGWSTLPDPTVIPNLQGVLWRKLTGSEGASPPVFTWTGGGNTVSTVVVVRGDVFGDITNMFDGKGVLRQASSTQNIVYASEPISNDNEFSFAFGMRRKSATGNALTLTNLANFTPVLTPYVPNGVGAVAALNYWQQTTKTNIASGFQNCSKPDASDTVRGFTFSIKTQSVAAAGFTAGPVVISVARIPTGSIVLGFTPSAPGTFYAVAVKAGTSAPSGIQIKAGLNAVGQAAIAAVNKAATAADTVTLGGAITDGLVDIYCVYHTTVDSSVVALVGIYLQPTSGRSFTVVSQLPAVGDLSILSGASPAAQLGDVIEWDTATAPGGFPTFMNGLGQFSYVGDNSAQSLNARLYQVLVGAWTANATFYQNNQPPQFVQGMRIICPLGVAVDEDLSDMFIDPDGTAEHDSSINLPNGLSIDGNNHLVGAVTVNGIYTPNIIATDPAGDTASGQLILLCGKLPVPDLSGMDRTTAQQAVIDANFNFDSVDAPSSLVPVGEVVSQSPAADSTADPDSTITVVFSTGPSGAVHTPREGLSLYVKRIYIDGPPYTLIGYTNPQGSLGIDSVLADLTQPAQTNGYAPILLDGNWSDNSGVATYAHSLGSSNDGFGNPCWFAAGAWSADLTGVALIDASLGKIQHFMDLRDGSGSPTTFTAAAGLKYAVSIIELATNE